MRRTLQRISRHGAALAGVFVAIPALLAAAPPDGDRVESLALPTGAVIRVWEERAAGAGNHGDEAPWFLAYSVSSGKSVTEGIVAGTNDPASDRSPRLARDPRSGEVILVWSRWDGVHRKIASSNFQRNGWADFHYLSFGRGDDIEPRIASGPDGAFVFWLSESKYMYAPLEIGAGRLLAASRALRLPGALVPSLESEFTTTDERTDNPSTGGLGSNPSGSVRSPGSATIDGQEGPVNPPSKTSSPPKKGSIWGVGSNGNCHRMTVVVTDGDGTHLLIFRFKNGATNLVRTIDLPSPPPPRFAEIAASSDLGPTCRD
jgi:hypothetical protein